VVEDLVRTNSEQGRGSAAVPIWVEGVALGGESWAEDLRRRDVWFPDWLPPLPVEEEA
jgi:hypothetical protein